VSADRSIAVLDIDGVLADVGHRVHHVRQRPKDWNAFFATMADDPLLPEGYALAWQLAEDHDVVYLTGRPADHAGVTREWLSRQRLPDGPVVHRRAGDRRPARVAKAHLLRALAARRTVHVAVDDDAGVCEAYRHLGIDVVHATWAPQPPELAREQESGRT
jgi:phosphoglycolate phosphatase-like HAD superfamily hydrolase